MLRAALGGALRLRLRLARGDSIATTDPSVVGRQATALAVLRLYHGPTLVARRGMPQNRDDGCELVASTWSLSN